MSSKRTTTTKGGRGKPKASKSVSSSSKVGLQFPVGRIARFLKENGKNCAEGTASWVKHNSFKEKDLYPPLVFSTTYFSIIY